MNEYQLRKDLLIVGLGWSDGILLVTSSEGEEIRLSMEQLRKNPELCYASEEQLAQYTCHENLVTWILGDNHVHLKWTDLKELS